MPLDYALALLLLTGSPDTPADPAFQPLSPLAAAIALELEILDPREIRYVLTRPDDFAADVKLLRRRRHELADAPPLHDCMRFPDRALVNDLLAFNRAYRAHLDGRLSLERVYWWEMREAIGETDRLYQIWDTVRDARCEYYYTTVRRQALKKLRDLVGDDNFHAATLPPAVPLWRFQRMR